MRYDPQKHHRRSIRLKGYDYSQAGAYCVTIVAQNRACLFGEVVNGEVYLNDAGQMLQSQWDALPERFANVELDEFIVMPNHMHSIVVIADNMNSPVAAPPADVGDRAGTRPAPPNDLHVHDPALGNIVGAWKSLATDEYIRGVRQHEWIPFERRLWQRNYWERIVRNEDDLNRTREYIINNPANWNTDEDNPRNAKP
jgi:REP-associated tyrosine transposase